MRFVSCRGAMVALALACATSSARALPFGITFADDVTAAAQTAFNFAAAKWADVLPMSYTGEAVNLRVDFSPITSLASTTTSYYLPGVAPLSPLRRFRDGFLYPDALIEYIHGADFGEAIDFTIEFNDSKTWFYGTDGAPGADEFDFVTVALHEIAHGLGLGSFIGADGSFMGGPAIYDRMLCNIPCTSLVYNMTPEARLTAVTSGDLQWIGSFGIYGNLVDGYSAPLELYAPPTFILGSSVSHVGPEKYPDELMRPAFARGDVDHTIGNITFGMLEDIGWHKIPEPSAWSLLSIALLALALSRQGVRRRDGVRSHHGAITVGENPQLCQAFAGGSFLHALR